MKRPLFAVGASYAIAMWASFFLDFGLILSAIGVTGALLMIIFRRENRAAPIILLSAAVAFAAFGIYEARAISPLKAAYGREVVAQGIILSVDDRRAPAFALTVRATFPEEDLPDTILRIRGWGGIYYQPGDGIRTSVILEELLGAQVHYNARGVFVGGRMVDPAAEPYTGFTLAEQFERFFLRQRTRATDNIAANISSDSAAMVSGVTLGETGGLDPALGAALSRSGVIHIVVVSGMHLSILVGLLTDGLGKLGVRRVYRSLAGMAGALAFSFLVGFSPSIARATVMMAVYLLAGLFSRRSDPINSLGLALLIISITAPHWLLSRGLWLSFAATAGIILYANPIADWFKSRYNWGRLPERAASNLLVGAASTTIAAYAFTLPIMVLTMGWVSLVSPVVNLLVAPLVIPTLLFGVLSAFFTGGWIAPLAWAADRSAGLIAEIALLASSLSLATFALGEFWKLIWILLACGIVTYLVYTKAAKPFWKYAAALLALAFAVGSFTLDIASRDKVELAAIEGVSPILLTRQGGAVLVGTPQLHEFARISRYLDYRGVNRLDLIVAYDAGNQITSALIRLAEEYGAPLIIGPDDDFILGQMALALPGREILSAGHATIDVLGGVTIRPHIDSGQMQIDVGGVVISKTGQEYDIMDMITPSHVYVFADGVMVWTSRAPPIFEPLGALIFGERRLVLSL
ncbi:MAG: ComEC/Rec2 family competence protein [Oscillospiraceae bacterium]|nr:ComEC/Rec2 family competence protein [Oscillospiraceae bacterium]